MNPATAANALPSHPDALWAEPDRYYFVEATPGVFPPQLYLTPVAWWLGVAPPAGPLRRALASDGRELVAQEGGVTADDPVSNLFVDADTPLADLGTSWREVYAAARPDADGSPRRDWSALCPHMPTVRHRLPASGWTVVGFDGVLQWDADGEGPSEPNPTAAGATDASDRPA